MKSSLRKFRGFALHKADGKGRRTLFHPPAHQDELAQATQEMKDMRNCYDSLLSAAAATANSAYEFSEALREMGTCLLEKTALNDDEEMGRILLMLGKAQFELQKLVDKYRIHIIQTITSPSESLIKELQTVEEMKRICDDKRDLYKFMLASHRDKGRSRNIKGESFSLQQLQAAQEEYDEDTTLFMFRLKSLKQGQSRSLLTQAARHHAAQLSFFRKGAKSLEMVEPHVKVVAEHQHIDYQFAGLDDTDDDDDKGYDDRESYFGYERNIYGQDVSTSRNSMELDHTEHTSIAAFIADTAQENHGRNQADYLSQNKNHRSGSQSAPLFTDTNFEPSNRIKVLGPSPSRKFLAYVLPTPVDAKSTNQTGSGMPAPVSQFESKDGYPTSLWLSTPLEPNKYAKEVRDEKEPTLARLLEVQPVVKQSQVKSGPLCGPSPLSELSSTQSDSPTVSDPKKIKRHIQCAPLAGQRSPSNPMFSATSSLTSLEYPPTLSAVSSHGASVQPSVSRKVSPGASPSPMSSPKISELHELPRPPVGLARGRRPGLIGHSAPLVRGGQDLYAASKMSSHKASPLPKPPGAMTRSYSIPSRRSSLELTPLEMHHKPNLSEDLISRPLTSTYLMGNQLRAVRLQN